MPSGHLAQGCILRLDHLVDHEISQRDAAIGAGRHDPWRRGRVDDSLLRLDDGAVFCEGHAGNPHERVSQRRIAVLAVRTEYWSVGLPMLRPGIPDWLFNHRSTRRPRSRVVIFGRSCAQSHTRSDGLPTSRTRMHDYLTKMINFPRSFDQGLRALVLGFSAG